jgi:hypothetical protein
MQDQDYMADPQQLRAEAEREPRRRCLDDYREAIRVLRDEKELSFREIAAWLQQRGLNVDHNAVWRTYSKGAPEPLGHRNREQNERLEQRRTHEDAMPWLKEPE